MYISQWDEAVASRKLVTNIYEQILRIGKQVWPLKAKKFFFDECEYGQRRAWKKCFQKV